MQKIQNKINQLVGSFFYLNIAKLYSKKDWVMRAKTKTDNDKEHISVIREKFKIDFCNLWEKCNILSVKERIKFQSVHFVFKTLKYGSDVKIINNDFFMKSQTSKRNLMKVNTMRGNMDERAIDNTSIANWNSLPESMRNLNISNNKFKKALNQYIMNARETVYSWE